MNELVNSRTGEIISGTIEGPLMAGQTAMQIKTAYATAISVQKPRDIEEIRTNLVKEAMLAGDSFFWTWPGTDIEGPSIGLATAAARCWGNCAVELDDVQELEDSWIFNASFIDLETGVTLPRQFRQDKATTVHGNFDDKRKGTIRFQQGQSFAIRNVILNALPSWLIDEAFVAAKSKASSALLERIKKDGRDKTIDLYVDGMVAQGVSEERILAKFRLTKRAGLRNADLIRLRADTIAIKNGQAQAEALYPGTAKPQQERTRGKLNIDDSIKAQEPPAEEKKKKAPAKRRGRPPKAKSTAEAPAGEAQISKSNLDKLRAYSTDESVPAKTRKEIDFFLMQISNKSDEDVLQALEAVEQELHNEN